MRTGEVRRDSARAGGAWPRVRRIAFDFDGVLMLSNLAKAGAFATAMRIPELQRADFTRRFIETGGTGRARKIVLLWQEFHGSVLSDSERLRIEAELSQRVPEAVLGGELVPGIAESLGRLRARGLAPSVISGTPEAELAVYLDGFGIRSLFERVLGSPTSKTEHLLALSAGPGSAADVYVGDTLEDARAAAAAGWSFVHVEGHPSGQPDLAEGRSLVSLRHAAELPAWVDSVQGCP